MALTEEDIVLLVARTRRAEREEEAQRRAQEEAAGAGGDDTGGRDRAIAATERSKHMSLLHDKTIAERAIHPWPNSSIRIPKDIVNLARHGVQIPLIWLTVEGLLDTSGQHRKFVTVPPTPKVQEYLAAAYEKDRFLPRGAFSQALQAFIALWNAVGPQAPAGTASQASLLEDMHLAILSHAVDEHWPIWRAYAKKVLDWVFEERAPGEGIGLNIAEIDQRLVAEAERECKYPPGRAIDFTNSDNTMVGKLLRAEGSEVARVGAEIDQLHRAATFGNIGTGDTSASAVPPSGPRADRAPRGILPSAGPSSWQRRDYDRGPQPFQRAPPSYPSRDGGAWPQRAYRAERDYYPARTPQFCTSCLEMVSDHDFRSCRRPYAKNLEEYNGGWRFPGKDLPFCNRYNCGGECTRGCTYGHYCSCCGDSRCHAAKHLRTSANSK